MGETMEVIDPPPSDTKGRSASVLSDATAVKVTDYDNRHGDDRPFAWLQITALTFCLVSHSVATSSLLTYVGVYAQHLLELPSISMSGYYASWLMSAFTFGTCLTTYAWGRFADRFGRKPVMIVGVCAIGVFSITFGLSTSFASALASRFLFGLANSMVPIGMIMAVELLGSKHVVVGMAFLPGSRAIGMTIGPAIGGLLAQPAVSYPSTFSSTGVFARYPFLLPNLAVALLAFASLPFVLFFLPETLHAEKELLDERTSSSESLGLAEDGSEGGGQSGIACVVAERTAATTQCNYPHQSEQSDHHNHHLDLSDYGLSPHRREATPCPKRNGNCSSCSEDSSYGEESKALLLKERGSKGINCLREGGDESPRRRRLHTGAMERLPMCARDGLLSPWRLRLLLLLDCLMTAMVVGFHQTYPLWLLASKNTGGLEWNVAKIGKVLGWTGVGTMVYQFIAYPALCRTVGIIRLLRASGAILALVFIFIPDIQHVSWSEGGSYAVGVALVVLVGSCTSVMETAMNLASANAVPVQMRGQFSGIFEIAGSVGRVAGPAVLGSLLAWSLNSTTSSGGQGVILNYHLVFVLEAIVAVVITALGWNVLTLESLTIPIEKRRCAYTSLPPVGSSCNVVGRDSLAGATTTAEGVEEERRRRQGPLVSSSIECVV